MKKILLAVALFATTIGVLAQDQTVNGTFFQNLNNQWLSPSKIQIGRPNTTMYKDRAVIGVTNGNLHLDSYSGYSLYLNYYQEGSTNGSKGIIITPNGRVGIGTVTPDQMLTVKGKIHAQEVLIDLNGPLADYVFKPDYNLMPLNELEQFVRANSHLPEIPSAAQVEENGINMGEMQNKLLQKIEELTLYVIEQDKKSQKQQELIESLQNRLNNIEK